MLSVTFREIKPGKEARLEAWLAELNRRADEVRATFADETVRAEQAFVVSSSSASMLVYVTELDDLERGAAAYAKSQRPIDAEHRAVMKECLGPALNLPPSYDVACVVDGDS